MLKSSGKTASSTDESRAVSQQIVGPVQVGRDVEQIGRHLDCGHDNLHGRSPRSDVHIPTSFFLHRLDAVRLSCSSDRNLSSAREPPPLLSQ